jgi:hypothetical protein
VVTDTSAEVVDTGVGVSETDGGVETWRVGPSVVPIGADGWPRVVSVTGVVVI